MDIVTAQRFKPGDTLVRAYWSAPRGYVNPGPEFNTDEEALQHAVAEVRAAVKQHDGYYAGMGQKILPLPESITLDLRWTIKTADGTHDFVAARESFKDIAAAEHRLGLIAKFRRAA